MDHFLLLGDSITQQAYSREIPSGETQECGSFGPALTDAYMRRLDIINRGLSGYNTRQALKILPQIIPDPKHAKVRFLMIFFGANDARLPNTQPEPQQHIPIEEYKENLRAIATHQCVSAHEDVRIVLVTPPPVDERKSLAADEKKGDVVPNIRRVAVVTARYGQVVRELGRELQIPVLDLWSAMMAAAGHTDVSIDGQTVPGSNDAPQSERLQALLHDGLHFTRAGYEVLYQELMDLIGRVWPDQMPEQLPYVLPAWDDEEAWKTETAPML